MKPETKVEQLWNWLPAFRAVAETEHLPTAAERLRISPSALSRSVRLLEDSLGTPLFQRSGRALILNADGQALMRATQDAMESIRGAIHHSEELEGPLVISLGGIAAYYIVDALAGLRGRHPALEPELRSVDIDQVPDQLLRGTADVALFNLPMADPRIDIRLLWKEPTCVWCGPEHPLYEVPSITMDQLLEYPFVAPPMQSSGISPDGWPPAVSRTVGLRTSHMHMAVRICGAGRYLASLPRAAARDWKRGDLRPIDTISLPSTPMYAAIRHGGAGVKAARAFLDAFEAAVAAEPELTATHAVL